MRPLLQKLVDLRPGEGRRTALMSAYLFLIIASHNILKPMTRSLFVSNLGPSQLPILYMVLALTGGLVVVVYLRLSANARLDRLINRTSLFLILNLLVFRSLLTLEVQAPWLLYTLYIWASLYGVLTTTQFWLLANFLFNAREAKRLFPFLTTCAILGGIAGGYIARFTVKLVGGTPNLAFFAMAFLGVTMVLMNLAWRSRTETPKPGRKERPSESGESFKVVGEVFRLIALSRHLALLVGIVAFTFMVVQIADFQFIAFASQEMSNTDDLTGFLGFWVSNLSILALIFQVLFANVIIRRFGVVATILFLPTILLLGSVWVFFSYGLVSILTLKIGDGAFRHSINKVGTELLYLPIPAEIKRKTKAFVDMFVDRFARGVAGVLLLVFYTKMGLSVSHISLIAIALALAWVVLSLTTYREYVNSFRQAIHKRRIEADLVNISIDDENIIRTLIRSLNSGNDRQVVYALRLLESVKKDVDLIEPLRRLLRHPAADVRLRTLLLIQQHQYRELLPEVKQRLGDGDELVRREAVRFYARFADEPTAELLFAWLHTPESGLREAALFCAAEDPQLARHLITPQLIDSVLHSTPRARAQLADALGELEDEKYNVYLLKLLEDPEPEVRKHALRSAGKRRRREFLPLLVKGLADRPCRKTAREALAAYGDEILEDLCAYLTDEEVPLELRGAIPKILAMMAGQRTVDVLLQHLEHENDWLRHQVIKALNKIRSRRADLKFDRRVDAALMEEIKRYFRILATLHTTRVENGKSGVCFALLTRTLQERLDDHLDRIFRLLGLRYPARDIYNAYAATNSRDRSIRANAVEFLDNILAKELKRVLIPIVEELPPEEVLQQANGVLDLPFASRKEALQSLLEQHDPWLRACTLYEIGRCGLVHDFHHVVQAAAQDQDAVVKETAEYVLKRFAPPAGEAKDR